MIILGVLLCICHFLGDFTPLSNAWMLRAKQFGTPLFPIAMHALVHAVLMFLVLLFFVSFNLALNLFFIQWASHFLIDTWKGRMNTWVPFLQDNSKRGYWMMLGFDQLLHQLTILGMVGLSGI